MFCHVLSGNPPFPLAMMQRLKCPHLGSMSYHQLLLRHFESSRRDLCFQHCMEISHQHRLRMAWAPRRKSAPAVHYMADTPASVHLFMNPYRSAFHVGSSFSPRPNVKCRLTFVVSGPRQWLQERVRPVEHSLKFGKLFCHVLSGKTSIPHIPWAPLEPLWAP